MRVKAPYIDPIAKLALLDGMYTSSNTTIPPVAPVCPTANCTFPLYNSLSICPHVANVTSLLEMTPENAAQDPAWWLKDNHTFVNLSLPNGAWMPAGTTWSLKSFTPSKPDYYPGRTASFSLEFNDLPFIENTTIVDFFVIYQIYFGHYSDNYLATFTGATYRAVEILFHWCVNTYSTTVTNGKATTEIVKSSNRLIESDEFLVLTTDGDLANYTVRKWANIACLYLSR